MMRSRNALTAEEGFHWLLPQTKTHIHQLIDAFQSEERHAMQCWLLELIGEARSDAALGLLCKQSLSADDSLRSWAIRGLNLLDTAASRTFLFQHGLK